MGNRMCTGIYTVYSNSITYESYTFFEVFFFWGGELHMVWPTLVAFVDLYGIGGDG